MREMVIDVLVTEIRLPGICGPDLVYWTAIESPETHFIAIADTMVDTIPNHACAVGCLRIIAKPVDPNILLSAVIDAIDCRERMSGRLSALSALDLIQTLCLGRKSASLRITAGDVIGSLLVRDGSLVHAISGRARWRRCGPGNRRSRGRRLPHGSPSRSIRADHPSGLGARRDGRGPDAR